MPAIITITFNPCIDKSSSVNVLQPDKKLRRTPYKNEAGGGGINVAKAVKKSGGNALAIYFLTRRCAENFTMVFHFAIIMNTGLFYKIHLQGSVISVTNKSIAA